MGPSIQNTCSKSWTLLLNFVYLDKKELIIKNNKGYVKQFDK